MPLAGLNHVNVITNDVPKTVAFYCDVLGLTEGDRPAFDFPGAWLYCGAEPIVHISGTRGRDIRSGVIDHIAFSARDLGGTLVRLERAGIRAVPRRQPGTGIWQVFVDDPNGARVELDFAPEETLERA
jgi:catechol 2,3-dioxygenase-like lactoylglutathione lyase family enzyme